MDLRKIGHIAPVTVMRMATLQDAAKIMRSEHVGDVLVVEEKGSQQFPVGIITDRDIVLATLALGIPTETVVVDEIMSTDLVVSSADESLIKIINLMKAHGVKRIPLLGKAQELVGLITIEDVMDLLSEELSALTEVARRQRDVEFQRRRKFA